MWCGFRRGRPKYFLSVIDIFEWTDDFAGLKNPARPNLLFSLAYRHFEKWNLKKCVNGHVMSFYNSSGAYNNLT